MLAGPCPDVAAVSPGVAVAADAFTEAVCPPVMTLPVASPDVLVPVPLRTPTPGWPEACIERSELFASVCVRDDVDIELDDLDDELSWSQPAPTIPIESSPAAA